jgi:hypothetical protein
VLELWSKKEEEKKEIMGVIEAKLLGRQVIKCSQKPISCPLLLMRMCRPPATTSSWLHGIINCD